VVDKLRWHGIKFWSEKKFYRAFRSSFAQAFSAELRVSRSFAYFYFWVCDLTFPALDSEPCVGMFYAPKADKT